MSMTLAARSDRWLMPLKGLFFPPVCLLCNRSMELSARDAVCLLCRPGLPPSAGGDAAVVSAPLNGLFALYRYGRGARRLVHRIKLTGDPRAGQWLTAELRRLPETSEGAKNLCAGFDAVVPVPSHRRASLLAAPGGGAAGLWADALASFLKIPVRDALRRTQTVPKQTSLNRVRRMAASASTLETRKGLLQNCRSVLLADDVCTTGATGRACAEALKAAGVGRVTLAVIARG